LQKLTIPPEVPSPARYLAGETRKRSHTFNNAKEFMKNNDD
jgi:hypothetical protein